VQQQRRNAAGRLGGTWVGRWERNAGVQLVFAGDKLIAFYWQYHYKDVARVTNAPECDKQFAWEKGNVTLTRTADGGAQLVVHEGKDQLSISLHRE
jgi:hypothetical protein